MESGQFLFKGFEPSPELRAYADAVLERLIELAPFGSRAFASLELDSGQFFALVDICSVKGPFVANARALDAETAIDRVARRISSKLDSWKQRRKPAGTAPRPLPLAM